MNAPRKLVMILEFHRTILGTTAPARGKQLYTVRRRQMDHQLEVLKKGPIVIHISDSQTVEKYENNVHKFEYLNF